MSIRSVLVVLVAAVVVNATNQLPIIFLSERPERCPPKLPALAPIE